MNYLQPARTSPYLTDDLVLMLHMFQYIEENEDFRKRLGYCPRKLDDLIELRKKKVLRQEQFRLENQVLLKEIENLEEERINLKKQVFWFKVHLLIADGSEVMWW